jgi:hypothetical protein
MPSAAVVLVLAFSAVTTGAITPSPRQRPAAESSSKVLTTAGAAGVGWSRTFHTATSTELLAMTWKGGTPADVEFRTKTAQGWSEWSSVTGNPGEGPDKGSPEDKGITAAGPIWVGHGVHDVQVRVPPQTLRSNDQPLAGLQVHALHATSTPARAHATNTATHSAAAATPQPAIHPRTDWGQPVEWQKNHDGCDAPTVAPTVDYAVAHHTETSNNYAPADVPAIVNAIWRFHVQTNGWCDIGYNFLVDRFGGVWEGRAGGITKAIVGAHAGGYNWRSFGSAMIGSFVADAVPAPMYNALVNVLAWKLALHGANPTGQLSVTPAAFDGSRYPAGQPILVWSIIGHRDVDQTGCPGELAYGLLPQLRADVQKVMAANQSPGGSDGYWMVATDGGIFAFGSAQFFGSMGGKPLNKPIVAMTATPDGTGYWLVASDGGIFAFGSAKFFGSMGGQPLNKPIVGMAPAADNKGYWLVASDGGIFAFGSAQFFGSMGGQPLNQPVVGMAVNRKTGGYWMVASDGGMFSFNAPFYGSMGGQPLNKPITSMAPASDSQGYRLVATDGGLFSFGSAPFYGSAAGGVNAAPITAIGTMGNGYRMVGRDGMLYSFGAAKFLGSAAHLPLTRPIVGMDSRPAA